MSKVNMFEAASQGKFRYPTTKGQATTEDLWAMPLTSTKGFSLNDTAKALSAEIKESGEENFVETVSAVNAEAALKLEIVKHIIAMKIAERDAAKDASEKKALKQKLLAIKERKDDESLEGKSAEEIQAMIDAL